MIFPLKMELGARIYSVCEYAFLGDSNSDDGRHDFNIMELAVQQNLCSQAKRLALFHEIGHAFMDSCGVNSDAESIPMSQEMFCDVFGEFLEILIMKNDLSCFKKEKEQ